MLKPRKSSGGQRAYQEKDIDLILRIKQMLYQEGYTIQGAKKRLRSEDRSASEKTPSFLLNKVKTELKDILEGIKKS